MDNQSNIPEISQLLDFSGKVVFVTGSSKGIGAGIAKRFAQAGADVAVHCFTHPIEAEAVKLEIEALGRKAILVSGDVSSANDVTRMFDEVRRNLGLVDVVINNAGNFPKAGLLDMTETEWDDMIDINLKSVFLGSQAAARQMKKSGRGGAIVNISSLTAVNPAHGHCHYAAAKAGIVGLTRTAALELGEYKIRVNAVGPGLINSPVLADNWPEGVASWMSKVPLGRIGEPADVADACLFLASDAARFITGEFLLVEGGIFTNPIY